MTSILDMVVNDITKCHRQFFLEINNKDSKQLLSPLRNRVIYFFCESKMKVIIEVRMSLNLLYHTDIIM